MNDFEYLEPTRLEDLPGLLGKRWGQSAVLAGGTDLLDQLKERLIQPERVVNLKRIEVLRGIKDTGTGLEIGALTTIAQLEKLAQYPVLAQAASSIATPQLRNMGTLGGNLCQRPRCWYFRGRQYPCLKKGGHKCYAVEGLNKYNAILNGGPSFIVHPSDAAPALCALGASLEIYGPGGRREVPIESFFQLPDENLRRENLLQPDEVLTRVRVPALSPGTRSTYLKFREKQSLDFALSSVAAVLVMDGKKVESARLVLGGVAPIPYRVPRAEAELEGKALSAASIAKAAEVAVEGAQPLGGNDFKVPLTRNLVRRALETLAA
ncbi:MAG: xanthine dehydrogenase family protein subunit M [Candidatus Handelsmanbacteria bacterium]|nr:xanthine dehydrogenase family protein subunit M [Candidatus Handelsmanbacteria bacterium]